MTTRATNESGRSIIEMLGVLAVIGVLSVGGLAGYSQAMAKYKVTKITDQVQMIVTNVRTLFSTQKNYASIANMEEMFAMGVVGPSVCGEGNRTDYSKCSGTFGGKFELGAALGDSKTGYYIFMDQIPQDACVRLAMSDWGAQSSGFLGLGITAENVMAMDASSDNRTGLYTTAAKTFPLDLSAALSACAKTNAMTWTYR